MSTAAAPATPTLGEWRAKAGRLLKIQRAVPWALGDHLLVGEQAFGERIAAALDELGLEIGEAVELARVGSRFPPERRRRGLSFAHHTAVADLEPVDADRLLDAAEAAGWTVRRLEREVRGTRR